MTKIRISILVMITIIFTVVGCTKENNELEDNTTSKQETELLKQAYGFQSLTQNVDKSNLSAFKSSVNLNKLTGKATTKEELNLKNVTKIEWAGDKTSYIIPFSNNPKKSIIILLDDNVNLNTNNVNYSAGTIIENDVNQKTGTGSITITTSEGKDKKTFVNGVLVVNLTGKKGKTFRQCFDDAYNDICNDAIGCTAWYVNPLVPATAIAYCAATTEPQDKPLGGAPLPTVPLEDEEGTPIALP
jgi:hypothetical protein